MWYFPCLCHIATGISRESIAVCGFENGFDETKNMPIKTYALLTRKKPQRYFGFVDGTLRGFKMAFGLPTNAFD